MPRTLPNLSLMNALYVCKAERRNDVVQYILDTIWPHLTGYLMRQFTLAKYRRAAWLARLEADPFAPVINSDAHATVQSIAHARGLPSKSSSHRLGLKMSEPAYQEAKHLLSRLSSEDISSLVNSGLNLTFLINALIDLQMDLPGAFNQEFLWLHLQLLIDLGCARSLCLPSMDPSDTPPAFNALTYGHITTGDPERIVDLLRTVVKYNGIDPQSLLILNPPGFKVVPIELAGTTTGTGAQFGAWGLSCLPRPAQLVFTTGSEWALLCAFLLWGYSWKGNSYATFEVRSESLRLVHCLNDWRAAPPGSIERFVAQLCAQEHVSLRARWVSREQNGRAHRLAQGPGKRLTALVDVDFAHEFVRVAEKYFRTKEANKGYPESIKIADSLDQWREYRSRCERGM